MADDAAVLIVRLEARIAQYQRDLERARARTDRDMGRIDRRIRSSSRSFNILARSVRQYTAAAGAALSAQAVIGYADAYTRATNTLRLYQEQLGDTSSAYERLYQTAQATRSSFESVSSLATRAAESVDASTEAYYAFTEATSIASQIASTSAQSAARSIAQLGQAIGSSRVQAEEFNSVVEGTPRLARAAAEGILGVGAKGGDLQRLIRNGENFSGQQLFEAIISQLPKLRAEFGTTQVTVSQALTKLDNAFGQYVGQQDRAMGASAMLAKGIEALADNLEPLGDALVVIAAVLTGRAIPAIVGTGVAAAASGTRIALLSRAVSILGVQATASAVAVRGLNAALAFFGGPVGLAVTVLAGSIAYLATKSSEAEKEAVRHSEAMEKIHRLNRDLAESTGTLAEETRKETEALKENTEERLNNLKSRLEAQLWLQNVGGDGAVGDFIETGVRTISGLGSAAGVYSSAADLKRKIANIEKEIAAIESGSTGVVSDDVPPSTSTLPEKVENDAKAIEKARKKLEEENYLLALEYQEYLKIARSRGIKAGNEDNFSDMSSREKELYDAGVVTRKRRVLSDAPIGLGEDAIAGEELRIGIERLKDQIGDLSATEKERVDASRRASEETSRALDALLPEYARQEKAARDWRDAQLAALDPKDTLERQRVEEAFAGKMAEIAKARQKETKAEQERQDAARAAQEQVRQAMADEIQLQAARARGPQAEREMRDAIDARRTAARLAAEAYEAGIVKTEAAQAALQQSLQAEIVASKEALALANDRADAMERNRATMERIAGLQRDLSRAGSAVAGLGDISGASSIEELDAILETVKATNRERERAAEIAQAEEAVQARIRDAHAEELPDLQQELALVREKVEARHAEADAIEQASEAEKERRAELERAKQAESRIRETAKSAEEARRRAEIEAIAASGALEADNLEDLRLVSEERERALAALERELAIKQAIDGLGDGATSGEVSAATRAAGEKFDNSVLIERENAAYERQKQKLEEIDSANKKIVDGIFAAIEGAESFEDALKKIGLQLLEMAANRVFENAFSGAGAGAGASSGGGIGGTLANIGSRILGNLFSFDGGGFTGHGSRSGGIDGRGGFPAILHPNETVIDHTRGQRASGPTSYRQGDVIVNGNADKASIREVRRMMDQQAEQTLAKMDRMQRQGLK